PGLALLIRTASLAFIVLPHGQMYRGLLEKNLMFAPAAAADIAWALSTLCFSVALTAAGLGAFGAVVAIVLGFVVKTIVLAVSGRRLFRIKMHFRLADTRRFVSFGVYQVLD